MDKPNLNQEKNNQKQLEAKVENYVSTEGITTKQLEIGLWYVEHKRLLRQALYGFLILLAAVSWTYTIYGFAYYLARGMSEDELLAKQLAQTQAAGHDYVLQVAAKDLAVGPVAVIKSADKKYDLFALVKNDNQKWWAEFNYYFVFYGGQTKTLPGYILPAGEKYFQVLAQESANTLTDARLIMENIAWHRVDQHQIPDWGAYYQKRLKIETADIKYVPAAASQLSERINLNQLSFNAINQTAYNYWEVGFTIIFYGGGNIASINHYILNDFMSGQKRFVEISWPGDTSRVDKVEIIPEINIMKDDIYIPYEGGTGQSSGVD